MSKDEKMAAWQKKLDELEEFKRNGQIDYKTYQKEKKKLESQKPINSKSAVGIAVLIGIILLVVTVVGAMNAQKQNNLNDSNETNKELSENRADERASIIDKYAPQYCATHQGKITTFEDPTYPSNDGSGWTNEECRQIIGMLYNNGSDDTALDNIVNSKVWVGMREEEVWYSLGNPDSVNVSNYGDGNTKQLVYGYNYVYTDSNGIVTSYQL